MSDKKEKFKVDEDDLEQIVGGRHNKRSPLTDIVDGVVGLIADEITLPDYQPQLPDGFMSASVCKYSSCHGSVCPSYYLCNDLKKQ